MQLDGLGKRYGLLPSEILQRGNTFDLYIMDCALTFENFYNKKAANGGKDPIPDYTQDELMTLLKKAKQ